MTRQIPNDVPSALCSTPISARMLSRFILALLREHFHRADLIVDPRLRDLVWNNDANSPILIKSHTAYNPEQANKRPAIIVKCNEARFAKYALGNRDMSVQSSRGALRFAKLWTGSATVFVIASEGAVDVLVDEVTAELEQIAFILGRDLGLHAIDVVEEGPPDFVQEFKPNVGAPITVAFAYERRWALIPQAMPIRAIRTTFL